MRRIILALVCMLAGAQVWGSTFDDESRALKKIMRETPFNATMFRTALEKSHLGGKENIDYRSYKTSTLLVHASMLENIPAMQIVIAKGADIEQIVHEDRHHDLVVVLLSEGKFESAAYLYGKLSTASRNRRDEELDKRAEETGRRMVVARAYENAEWAKRHAESLKKLKEANSFSWKDFLGLVAAVGGSL